MMVRKISRRLLISIILVNHLDQPFHGDVRRGVELCFAGFFQSLSACGWTVNDVVVDAEADIADGY